MKRIFGLLLLVGGILTASLLATSCKKDESYKLVGTWVRVVNSNGDKIPLGKDEVYGVHWVTYFSDGSFAEYYADTNNFWTHEIYYEGGYLYLPGGKDNVETYKSKSELTYTYKYVKGVLTYTFSKIWSWGEVSSQSETHDVKLSGDTMHYDVKEVYKRIKGFKDSEKL